MSAPKRVYRVKVLALPEGSDEDDWEPPGWGDDPTHWGKDPETNADELAAFYWPALRNYLSKQAAERRADLYRKYGATVEVETSDPITWPTRTNRQQPNTNGGN